MRALVQVRKVTAQTAHWAHSDGEAGALNVFSATLCGRSMVLGEWSEVHNGTGWSRTVGHGPAFLLQPCMRCAAKLAKLRSDAHAEAIEEDAQRAVIAREYAIAAAIDEHEEQQEARRLTALPELRREYVGETDTYTLHVDGVAVGTVDSTRDRTGDRYARRASGEIVAPRFSDTSGAEAYLTGGPRAVLCGDGGAHAYGACIREREHYGEHVSAQGHRWSDDDTARIVAERKAQRATVDITIRTEWGTVASDGLAPSAPVTIERNGRTMRVRADEVTNGDTAPIGGLVGTVTSAPEEDEEEAPSGPVDIAVRATAALLGTTEEEAREHLSAIYRSTVVDVSAQDVIAAAYDALPELDTFRPGSLAELAWEAFAHETLSQAHVLRSLGVRWSAVDVDPYANAGELFAELRSTGGIRVLSSRSTGGHPFLSDTVNDTFRAVHDILGHAATGRGFDRHGEEAAYQAHAALYSPLARQALATETRGQNASMLRAGGVFPPQRVAILPEWARATDALKPSRGRYDSDEIADMRADAARDHAAQGLGELYGPAVTGTCRDCWSPVTWNGARQEWRDAYGSIDCPESRLGHVGEES